ncbi:MarR family winged helix-turn-helix transcriptional regulator [Tepidicella xavieri]|jgi:DNA-binding MarR family transcriptional regulator|uniref:MarR family transcriptional regulator n=1 Tax=Tepidicella xavieri TaxID=360241 RepID=A0A4R6UDZ1_9BURK|nr:MarR family transcriptional regulator [Tepidicella xavieri]TDQ44332.1 MarR family transcriptional regulator [Tepidicella xavieri]
MSDTLPDTQPIDTPDPLGLNRLPGHAIRRLHQIAVGIFHQEVEGFHLTPLQYGALWTVREQPGIDQRTLARLIALDTSTTAGVVDRLEARGLLQRRLSAQDRRVRLLHITEAGQALLAEAEPAVARAQALILAPLTGPQQRTFMRLLLRLVEENNAFSRAPSE